MKVRSYGTGIGSYALSFIQLSKPVNFLPSITTFQVQLRFPGDVQWYTFDGKIGDTVDIMLSKGNNDNGVFPWLGLLAPDGSVVFDSYDVGRGHATGHPVQTDKALPQTGTYIIRIRNYALVGGLCTLSLDLLAKR